VSVITAAAVLYNNITFTWNSIGTNANDTGGYPILSYTMWWKKSTSLFYTSMYSGTGLSFTQTSGWTAGTTYNVAVKLANVIGDG